MFYGRSSKGNNVRCSEDYINAALRTYLLVHQVRVGRRGLGNQGLWIYG